MDDDEYKILRGVTEYAARNHCLHEETHRGGILWEICDSCGAKWADDEGGIPEDAREYPEPIKNAIVFLDSIGALRPPEHGGRPEFERGYIEGKQYEKDRLANMLGLK